MKEKLDEEYVPIPGVPPPDLKSGFAPLPSQKQTGPPPDCDYSHVTNEEVITKIYQQLPQGSCVAVCSKPRDPTEGPWSAKRFGSSNLPSDQNNYLSCSSFRPEEDGTLSVRNDQFSAYHFLLLDDLGTKVPFERLGGFELSLLIETSPNNYQGFIILEEPISDREEADRLLKAVISSGLCDKGASGLNRWARLPCAINGKEKYKDAEGEPFRCRLMLWLPEQRYSPQKIIDGLKLEMTLEETPDDIPAADVSQPGLGENPVIASLRNRGLYKRFLGSGKHDITCPWVHEHTDALDDGCAYFEPSDEHPFGGFRCHHSHGEERRLTQLLEFLEIPMIEAGKKPVIRVVPGELERVVDTAEQVLANSGKYYQAGGLIVSVSTNPATSVCSILPIGVSELTRQLSVLAMWEKPNQTGSCVRCDPPSKHVKILNDSKSFEYLLPLAGLARQPYFRESDQELVMQPGYDKTSMLFGVFDPSQYPIPDGPTMEDARSALGMLEDLLTEFHFVSSVDKAAALSAIFTAVVRPSLPLAPAYHVKAPVFGSGKSYLCELIGAFAGPGGNAKVSYPKTSEEATKVMLSLLLGNPAVAEFDDMDIDWIPHGVMLRMLTAEHITDRILGYSKTATVSTRTLLLGSGNNVGPVRDLLRRVLTINIDPRCSTPSTISYKGSPLDKVRQDRGRYVAAVLTIILAWRKSGSPRSDIESIASFGGAWTDYCRQPLMWLGHPDPASALLDQVNHDPDSDALGRLMTQWKLAFGSNPTTVRKAIDEATFNNDLMDAMKEFPIEERGSINRSKFGWFLKKNANRIVGGHEFQRVESSERLAWRVASVSEGGAK